MAKKWDRVLVWLVCTECGRQNYVKELNKANSWKITLKKYSPTLRKHTLHKVKYKLK